MSHRMIPPTAVGGLCVVLLALQAEAQPPLAPAPVDPEPVWELVAFTADGPVRVRARVTVGGRPPAEGWRAAVDGLFRFLDHDRDGRLSAAERGPFAKTGQTNGFVVVNGMLFMAPRLPNVSFPAGDKVDPHGFRESFRPSFGPVGVSAVAVGGDSPALTDALFKRLDADRDGKLSAAELAAAPARLAPLDANEDELLSADELLEKFANPFANAIVIGGNQQTPEPPVLPDVFYASSGQRLTAKLVLAARDKNKDGGLTADELATQSYDLGDLDHDGDGRLDADEVAAWLRRPADLDVSFDLSADVPPPPWWVPELLRTPTATRPARGLAVSGRFGGKADADTDGKRAADLGDLRVRFAADTAAAATARSQWKAAADGFRSALVGVAEKGVIERKKIEEDGQIGGTAELFDLADRDGDKKATPADLERVFRAGERLVNCRAVVEIADRGRGLFELLDRDGDGTLSPRERAAAGGHLTRLDRDRDGKLARDELPRGLSVTVKPASVDLLPAGPAYDFSGQPVARRTKPPAADLPGWFTDADRNGDGDVSAREFPGPPGLFKRLDRTLRIRPMRPADLFRFCPRCGAARPADEVGRVPVRCGGCDLTLFLNPAVAAGAWLFDPAGRVLLIRRAHDPQKGKFGLPGGFLDPGESAEDGLRREVREEVGLEVEALTFLVSVPNRYEYKGVTYPVADLIFTARAVAPETARPLDGVAGIEWHRPAAIDPADLAFPSMRASVGLLQGAPGERGA